MPNKRNSAIQKAREILVFDPIFLDTETTGLGPDAEIVEIAVLDRNGQILFEKLVKPSGNIPLDASRIHGITDKMVENAPSWKQVWKELNQVITGRYVGVYNVEFDIRMLSQSNLSAGIEWTDYSKFFCIMKLYADFYPYGGGRYQKLEEAGRQLGLPYQNSHRAAEDTRLALEVFKRISGSVT